MKQKRRSCRQRKIGKGRNEEIINIKTNAKLITKHANKHLSRKYSLQVISFVSLQPNVTYIQIILYL